MLADRGFFPASDPIPICHYQSWLTSAIRRGTYPGVEMNTGALGHGLPICIGMASGQNDSASYRVFTLLGDGELAEGSN